MKTKPRDSALPPSWPNSKPSRNPEDGSCSYNSYNDEQFCHALNEINHIGVA